MTTCPICSTVVNSKINNTPYWDCRFCGCWFQAPLPPKVYEADHEKGANGEFTGHLMSDNDKEINKYLADTIFTTWLGSGQTDSLGDTISIRGVKKKIRRLADQRVWFLELW